MPVSFDQKAILTLYRRFYGCNYSSVEQTTDAHILAQNMSYLLSIFSIYAGDFGYSWDMHGTYSPGLHAELISLDKNKDLAEEFYAEHPTDELLFTDKKDSGLFFISQKEQTDLLRQQLKVEAHENDLRTWMELLGSLAYIAKCNMPGMSMEEAAEELDAKRIRNARDPSQLTEDDPEMIREAWDALRQTRVVS